MSLTEVVLGVFGRATAPGAGIERLEVNVWARGDSRSSTSTPRRMGRRPRRPSSRVADAMVCIAASESIYRVEYYLVHFDLGPARYTTPSRQPNQPDIPQLR